MQSEKTKEPKPKRKILGVALSKELHKKLRLAAAENETSMSNLTVQIIRGKHRPIC